MRLGRCRNVGGDFTGRAGVSYRLHGFLSRMRCKDKNWESIKLFFQRVSLKTRKGGIWDLDKGRGESLVQEVFGIQGSGPHDTGRCGRQETLRPIYPGRD